MAELKLTGDSTCYSLSLDELGWGRGGCNAVSSHGWGVRRMDELFPHGFSSWKKCLVI